MQWSAVVLTHNTVDALDAPQPVASEPSLRVWLTVVGMRGPHKFGALITALGEQGAGRQEALHRAISWEESKRSRPSTASQTSWSRKISLFF